MTKKKEIYLYWKARRALTRIIFDDRQYTERRFVEIFGRPLDLENPRTFNEKIQWIKLYYRRPMMTRLADKYLAREYIKENVGKQYLPGLLGVYDSVESFLDHLQDLPERFVLKATHGCGWNIFVTNKTEISQIDLKTMRRWLASNYYHWYREWAYKNIQPRIIAEAYIEPDDPALGLMDYKYYCFHGQPRFVQVNYYGQDDKTWLVKADVDNHSEHRENFYDLDWQRIPVRGIFGNFDKGIPEPKNHQHMIEFARVLSMDWPFLRVDFYSTKGIMVGELTLYPASGLEPFSPEKYDYRFGEMLDLSKISADLY